MISLNRHVIPAASIALGVVLFAGCASMVKKPEINGVRTVAIISVSADEMVPWTGGSGRIDNWDDATKHRVANHAYDVFAKEFKRLGWNVISRDKVAQSASYKKEFGPQQVTKDSNILAKTANFLGNAKNARYFSATELFPIRWPDKNDQKSGMSLDLASFKLESKKDFHGQLADLAKDLHVDAVALVYLDYCYTGATAVLGNGTAKMTAGSFVKVVNPDKVTIVDMKPIADRCGGDRGESNKTVAMVGGSIALGKALASDTLVQAFDEATDQSAKLTVDAIHKAMQD